MVKKIKKYLKFVVCCALIMSLIAPSYAALSASDGSAFVTKAEFDSALADFNARLTTFEAGINSKIDSQVTSYLDRNGIWNGATQTLVPQYANGWFCEYPITDEGRTFAEDQVLYIPILHINSNNDELGRAFRKKYGKDFSAARGLVTSDVAKQSDVIIDNVTKSGLLFVDYNVRLIMRAMTGNIEWAGWQNNMHTQTSANYTGGWYTAWYKWYYNKTPLDYNLHELPHDTCNVYYRGIYTLQTVTNHWFSWSLTPWWSFDVLRGGVQLELARTAGDTYQVDSAFFSTVAGESGEWGVMPFGDYKYSGTSLFFVSKGDKVLCGGGANVSGWMPESFWSYYRQDGVAMVLQPKSLVVY